MNKLTKEKYDAVPNYIKENLYDAMVWANATLVNKEGEGWNINVIPTGDNGVCCCFDKSEWQADFCGDYVDVASEAVVLAVCEYLTGI